VSRNNPVFVANTAKHYLVPRSRNNVPQYLARGKKGFHEMTHDFVTARARSRKPIGRGTSCSPFVKAAQTPVRTVLTTFWSMAAVSPR